MNRPDYKYFKDEQENKQSDKLFIKFAIVLFVIYAFIFGTVFIYHSNFEYVTINGESMQNTLNPNPELRKDTETGEYNFVQDGVYIKITTDVDYGDIVVINKTKTQSVIKRVLAFGGDYITIASINYDGNRDYRFMRVKSGSDKVEIINEEDYIKSYYYWNMISGTIVDNVEYENPLYSYYINQDYQTKTFTVNLDGEDRNVIFFKVPDKHIFYMGDNRTGSKDARTGTMPQANIQGYVVKVVHNGTFIKDDPTKWFFKQIEDFFSIVWREISIFFGAKA